MMKRVVVTGLGPVSSIGIGKDSFWASAKEGKKYFRNVNFPEEVEIEQYRCRICSPVDNYNPEDRLGFPKKLRRAGRATQYALLGSALALEDAGFVIKETVKNSKDPKIYFTEGLDPLKCGVILGQSVNNTDIMIPEHTMFVKYSGPKKVNPFTLPQSNVNVGASSVAEWFYLKGTNLTISTACSSATHAIGIAALNIQQGIEDVMVTGGSDYTLEPYFFSGFDIINALSRRNDEPMKASRPFDKDRDGFVIGEGAGIIILEELNHALKRDARIYGEIIGYGFSADAHNIVAPDPHGSASIDAIKKALSMGRVSTEEVEYINAHGTSTILNDPNESYIIKQVFGDYAYNIPISSSKSYFGHTLGAAGGLESIVTLLTICHSIVTPTSNLDNPDVDYVDRDTPELDKRCDLDYVPEGMRVKEVNLAINQSFGFGGQNGALLFRKFEQ